MIETIHSYLFQSANTIWTSCCQTESVSDKKKYGCDLFVENRERSLEYFKYEWMFYRMENEMEMLILKVLFSNN